MLEKTVWSFQRTDMNFNQLKPVKKTECCKQRGSEVASVVIKKMYYTNIVNEMRNLKLEFFVHCRFRENKCTVLMISHRGNKIVSSLGPSR